MKTAVILNDTSTRYHHGCKRVSRRIKELLVENGITVLSSNYAHMDWRRNRAFIDALAVCDLVVINGEGTLHDAAEGGGTLLAIIDAPERGDRPVVLVNALWQNNPLAWSDVAKRCSIVAVRDSQSAHELQAAGVRGARLMPDLSLTGPVPKCATVRNQAIIGDSVRARTRHVLAKAAQHQRAIYIPTKTLGSAIWKRRLMSELLWRVYNGVMTGPMPEFRMPADDEAYLRDLGRASTHITGRFHGVCLSILTATPFLAIASKTSKVQTLVSDAGLDPSRVISEQALMKDPSLAAPPFSADEIRNMINYVDLANSSADALFRDIRAVL